MIPENITSQNILDAISRVDVEGVPIHREARDWAVLHNGVRYPCKLLISWANEIVNGQELDSKSFISYEARTYLIEKMFNVVPI